MKSKLFFVINSLEGGGAERVVSLLSNDFDRKQFDVTVLCLSKKQQAYPLSEGVKLISLVDRKKESTVLFRFWYVGLTFIRLLSVLSKNRPQCVVSFMTKANLWTGMICLILKIPFVVSERTTPDYKLNKFKYFLKWLSVIVYGRSRAIVVPAKGMVPSFQKNRSFRKFSNFRIIRNPLSDLKEPGSARVHPRKFILGVGRIDKQKGFDQLIEAYHKLNLEDVDLLISGDGAERENLSRQIRSLGLESKVKLIGFRTDLEDYYSQAELFVLASRREGYPNVLIEAMSYGCPSVAMDCEFGPSEIIDNGNNGILIERNNVEMLSRAISDVLKDTALKEKLSRNALRIKETNSLRAISAQWEQLILNNG